MPVLLDVLLTRPRRPLNVSSEQMINNVSLGMMSRIRPLQTTPMSIPRMRTVVDQQSLASMKNIGGAVLHNGILVVKTSTSLILLRRIRTLRSSRRLHAILLAGMTLIRMSFTGLFIVTPINGGVLQLGSPLTSSILFSTKLPPLVEYGWWPVSKV